MHRILNKQLQKFRVKVSQQHSCKTRAFSSLNFWKSPLEASLAIKYQRQTFRDLGQHVIRLFPKTYAIIHANATVERIEPLT